MCFVWFMNLSKRPSRLPVRPFAVSFCSQRKVALSRNCDRRFENRYPNLPSANRQSRPHSKRQRNVSSGYMPRTQTIRHRHFQPTDNSHNNFLQGVALVRILHTIHHLAENNTSNAVELPRQL